MRAGVAEVLDTLVENEIDLEYRKITRVNASDITGSRIPPPACTYPITARRSHGRRAGKASRLQRRSQRPRRHYKLTLRDGLLRLRHLPGRAHPQSRDKKQAR
eukprot:COSAG01_NODE_53903_length_336_cov_0.400844_1_plen_102_part_01